MSVFKFFNFVLLFGTLLSTVATPASSNSIVSSQITLEQPFLAKLQLDESKVQKGLADYTSFKATAFDGISPSAPLKENINKSWAKFQVYFKTEEALSYVADSADFRIGVDSISEAIANHEIDCDTGTLLFLDALTSRYKLEELSKQVSLLYFNSHLTILLSPAGTELKDSTEIFDIGDEGVFTSLKKAKEVLGPWMQVIPLTPEGIKSAGQLMLGLALGNVGLLAEQLSIFKSALKTLPMPAMYSNAGSSLLALGKPKEALEYFEKAKSINMKDSYFLDFQLSTALRELGKTAEADKLLSSANKSRWPTEPEKWKVDKANIAETYIWWGITFLDSLRPDIALQYFNKAKKISPKAVSESLWKEAQDSNIDTSQNKIKKSLDRSDPKIADQWLNRVYGILRAALSVQEKNSLKKQQRDWLKTRDRASDASKADIVWKRVEELETRLRSITKSTIKNPGTPTGKWFGKFSLLGNIARKSIELSPSEKENWVRVSGSALSRSGNIAEIGEDFLPAEALILENQAIFLADSCRVIIRPKKRVLLVDDQSEHCGGFGANFSGVYIRTP